MECVNQRKRVIDWRHCELPAVAELKNLTPGCFIRLCDDQGRYFWARVMRVNGSRLECVSDDSLPGFGPRGTELVTSTGAVFNIV
jgi:hypothetical protein